MVNMSLGTDCPTASLESAIDFAISQGVIIVASAGNRGPDGMGWPGAFPQVISAGAIGWTRNGPNRLGVGSSRMSSRKMPTRALSPNFSSRELQASSFDLVAPDVAVFCPGAASPQTFRALSARGSPMRRLRKRSCATGGGVGRVLWREFPDTPEVLVPFVPARPSFGANLGGRVVTATGF